MKGDKSMTDVSEFIEQRCRKEGCCKRSCGDEEGT